MSKRRLKKITSLLIITFGILFIGKAVRINQCIERGGSWDKVKSICRDQVATAE